MENLPFNQVDFYQQYWLLSIVNFGKFSFLRYRISGIIDLLDSFGCINFLNAVTKVK